jgi:octaprenyl-diphosphate synthase
MVRENNGMEYAIQKMNDYKKEAENILFEFPDSAARNSIFELIQFTINRKN